MASLLSESAAARIWADGREPVLANAGNPGKAVRVDGGFRLSGTWNIVSGIDSADWFIPVGIVLDGDSPRQTDAGGPHVRLFHLPTAELTVQRTWQASGMRGSGSNTVVADNLFVPSELPRG